MAYIMEFLRILKQRDVHIACDTCGDVPWENFACVLPYVDVFLYDIKAADGPLHKHRTGQDNRRIIANLEKLHRVANVWLRIPVIGGVNDGAEMAAIIALAKDVAPNCKVSLLPYHHMGEGKWGKAMEHDFYTPSVDKMQEIALDWQRAGFEVEIGG
jgi:pyruvate formate lyase activating enzyme